jgi:hypothetical protein
MKYCSKFPLPETSTTYIEFFRYNPKVSNFRHVRNCQYIKISRTTFVVMFLVYLLLTKLHTPGCSDFTVITMETKANKDVT